MLGGAISTLIPALTYRMDDVHTTVSSFGVTSEFVPDPVILARISQVVESLKIKKSQPTIRFDRWIMSRASVIAAASPNNGFYTLACLVVNALENDGALMPKMAHITTVRFLQEIEGKDLQKVDSLLQATTTPGQSTSRALVGGYFSTTRDSFDYHIHCRLALN